MRVISYLNMHRARLGYVNCVLLAADVQLDTAASLRRRLEKLLFENIVFTGSSEFGEFSSFIDPGKWTELAAMTERRSLRKSKTVRRGVLPPSLSISGAETDRPTLDVYAPADLWLAQREMRSSLGRLLPEYADEPIELAKDLCLLSQSYALTEFGNVLKGFLLKRFGDTLSLRAAPNPLDVYGSLPERILYLYALLSADALFPAMLDHIVASGSTSKSLVGALDRVLAHTENSVRLDEVNQLKNISKLRTRLEKEPVDKAQRVPRLEFMVDLGLLERVSDKEKGESQYATTDAAHRFVAAFQDLLKSPNTLDSWLDHNFFSAAAAVYDIPVSRPHDEMLTLLYFVRGAAHLGRRMGFIPGRAASIAGSILALSDGYKVEVADLFRCAYNLPKTQWSQFVKFSGGSRLDNEFLVAIDPLLEAKLRAAIPHSGPSTT